MTKIAMIADSHWGVRNDNRAFHEYFRKSHEWFFSEIEKRNIDTIVHLGDLYDRRKYINYVTASACRRYFIEPIMTKGMTCHIISGNHDISFKNTSEVNALDELISGRYDKIHTYTEACETILPGDLKVLLVPWITPENSQKSYDAIKNTDAEIVMGHLELNGFEMFKGMVSDHGDDIKIYDKFDMVFTGHYHHRSSKGNIHYIGAFGEYTWSDYKDPRGFTIFDTETREFEFLDNPHHIFNALVYDDVKTPNILEKINKTNYDKYQDTYVKVICVNRTDPYAFDQLLDKLHKASPLDIAVVEDISNIIETEEELLDEAQDTPTLLDSYINSLTLPVDNDKMKSYMKEVYKEAISTQHI